MKGNLKKEIFQISIHVSLGTNKHKLQIAQEMQDCYVCAPFIIFISSGTHKRTYRLRSNVHSQFRSTQNIVYSMNFYNSHKKQEIDLHEMGLKYQGLQPMPPRVISSTKERSKRIRPTVFRQVLGSPIGLMQVAGYAKLESAKRLSI